ncbi:MAG: hypothetical protein ABI548_03535 [Polyangiaceae bacterium]
MSRINGLVQLLFSNDSLKSTSVFGPSTGPRADILRSIVVFLHASFEVAFRCFLPKTAGSASFYSRTDFDKALKRIGVDAAPFRPLYPPLTQMAKRRKEIVHNADLDHDAKPREWSIADDWQLIIWLMAVPAFYYQLRLSLNLANNVEQAMYERLQIAMTKHVEFGEQLFAFPSVPSNERSKALQKVAATLGEIATTLHLDAHDFVTTGPVTGPAGT